MSAGSIQYDRLGEVMYDDDDSDNVSDSEIVSVDRSTMRRKGEELVKREIALADLESRRQKSGNVVAVMEKSEAMKSRASMMVKQAVKQTELDLLAESAAQAARPTPFGNERINRISKKPQQSTVNNPALSRPTTAVSIPTKAPQLRVFLWGPSVEVIEYFQHLLSNPPLLAAHLPMIDRFSRIVVATQQSQYDADQQCGDSMSQIMKSTNPVAKVKCGLKLNELGVEKENLGAFDCLVLHLPFGVFDSNRDSLMYSSSSDYLLMVCKRLHSYCVDLGSALLSTKTLVNSSLVGPSVMLQLMLSSDEESHFVCKELTIKGFSSRPKVAELDFTPYLSSLSDQLLSGASFRTRKLACACLYRSFMYHRLLSASASPLPDTRVASSSAVVPKAAPIKTEPTPKDSEPSKFYSIHSSSTGASSTSKGRSSIPSKKRPRVSTTVVGGGTVAPYRSLNEMILNNKEESIQLVKKSKVVSFAPHDTLEPGLVTSSTRLKDECEVCPTDLIIPPIHCLLGQRCQPFNQFHGQFDSFSLNNPNSMFVLIQPLLPPSFSTPF